MNARITIQSGIAAGTSHRIAGRVARVGSDPQSEVCVPSANIPGHALTLEFREEHCLVYNRCRESIYIGAQTVEPDQALEWPETDILQLGVDTELLLDFDSGSSDDLHEFTDDEFESDPKETSSTASDDSALAEIQQHLPSTNKSKIVVQLCVTLVCLAGCVLLLVRDQNRKSSADTGPRFSDIISASLAQDGVSPVLIRRLQFAEAQRVRGREEVAYDEYQSIRDDLVAQLGRSEQALEEPNSQILQFIQTRLASEDRP